MLPLRAPDVHIHILLQQPGDQVLLGLWREKLVTLRPKTQKIQATRSRDCGKGQHQRRVPLSNKKLTCQWPTGRQASCQLSIYASFNCMTDRLLEFSCSRLKLSRPFFSTSLRFACRLLLPMAMLGAQIWMLMLHLQNCKNKKNKKAGGPTE